MIAYLSGAALVDTDECENSRLMDTFRTDAVWSFNFKRLRAELARRRIGSVEIRARRFPIRPDELRSQLRLKGDNAATIICTRIDDSPVVVLCHRVDTRQSENEEGQDQRAQPA